MLGFFGLNYKMVGPAGLGIKKHCIKHKMNLLLMADGMGTQNSMLGLE